MSREENVPGIDPESKFNPYAAPRALLEPARGGCDLRGYGVSGVQTPISVIHDLTDDELRRFVRCDAFYDPMPLFGFIPQWLWLISIIALIGFSVGTRQMRLYRAAFVDVSVLSMIFLAILVVMAKATRTYARRDRLCEKRTLTITPKGLTLTIPGVSTVPMRLASVGPMEHPWGDFREIEATEDSLIFWLKGRSRLVLPRRAFPSQAEADSFLQAATRLHKDTA